VLGVFLIGIVLYANSSSVEFSNGNNSQQLVRKDQDGIIRFPDYALNVTNVGGEDFDGIYTSVSKNITNNTTEFLSTFRTAHYDGHVPFHAFDVVYSGYITLHHAQC